MTQGGNSKAREIKELPQEERKGMSPFYAEDGRLTE